MNFCGKERGCCVPLTPSSGFIFYLFRKEYSFAHTSEMFPKLTMNSSSCSRPNQLNESLKIISRWLKREGST